MDYGECTAQEHAEGFCGNSGMGSMVESSGKDRDELILQFQYFVRQVAGSLVNSMNLPPAMFDEYVAAGYLGLVEAAERFDFSQGRDFRNFAYLRIRGSIIDTVRKTADVPGYVYNRYVKALKAAQALREQMHEQEKSSGAPAGSREALAGILEYLARSALAFRIAEREMPAGTADGKPFPDPCSALEMRQDRELIRDLVSRLPEKERKIIESYYFGEMSFVAIARASEDMSKSWVSRLHARALKRLKEAYCDAHAV